MSRAIDTAPLLEVRGLCAWYGPAQALFDVDLEVAGGEVVALIGRNGAGKSTTLKAILGLCRRRGSIRLKGAEIAGAEPHAIARAGVGYVPQDRRIFTRLTVRENLDVGRKPGQAPGPWTAQRLFEFFPNLASMPDRRGGEMSGGEQQMLALARTLMGNPQLLLLDEPSEGVAPAIVANLVRLVRDLSSSGVGILLSEQNRELAKAVAQRAYAIEQGAVRPETLEAFR